MPVTIRHFVPTAMLSSGKPGLSLTLGTTSSAAIIGANLDDHLDVTVTCQSPSFQWTGKTIDCNKPGTQCSVFLTGAPVGDAFPPPKENPTSVNVTVSDGSTTTDTLLGMAPVLANGQYTVQCNASGTYRWLAEATLTSVNLANVSDPPQQWTFTLVPSGSNNCYTIQASNQQYLNWNSDGTVTLVQNPGPGTTWQLNGSSILTMASSQLYLNGNTSSKVVNLEQNSNANTSWTIALPPL